MARFQGLPHERHERRAEPRFLPRLAVRWRRRTPPQWGYRAQHPRPAHRHLRRCTAGWSLPQRTQPKGCRAMDDQRLALLTEIERKALWLSCWTVHHANHLRPKADNLKVGGHQASSASMVSILTALYFSVLRPQDRIAVKPHAAPVFHAIQYLMGNQTRASWRRFGASAAPSPIPAAPRTSTTSIFRPGQLGLASR